MKMRLLGVFILMICVFAGSNTYAQTEPNQFTIDNHKKAYMVALKYNDFDAAKSALYHLLVEEPTNDSLLYALSYIYFQSQKYTSAVLTAQDVLKLNPDRLQAIEISAICFENLGIKDKALTHYESLYLKTDDYQTLYKIAFLQFDLKRFNESRTNIDILLGKPEADEVKVVYNNEQNEQKEYPIKVSLLNLKGLISQEQGDKATAKQHFEEALKVAPDFVIAKKNLEGLGN
ncbi:MAG: hypothetical protein AAFX87_02540 [Bacteroidota bacterium]